MLIENLKSYEQFDIDMGKDNREISSSLELLRERMNCNFSCREGDRSQTMREEDERLKVRIGELTEERDRLIQEHN